ncbi:MAG: hypothetical protein ACOY4H_14175, partial [Thermodesulfobacteriota bacterium]
HLAMPELMAHDPEIADAETKPFSDKLIRQPFNKRGAQGFVPPLPVGDWPGEKGGILHVCHYNK